MIAHRIRSMRSPQWIILFCVIIVCWLAILASSTPPELREVARIFGGDALKALCATTPDALGLIRLSLMWALMSAAMMLPSALPAFAVYEDLGHSTPIRFGSFVAGYSVVWLGISGVAASLQIALFQADLVSTFGESRSSVLSAILLMIAGLYQFSNLKEACLSKCRQPLTFFMQHWEDGAFRNGVRLGAVCLGCCWALMLLGFVGGVMNLGFMALATILMTLEKLQIGAWITRPLGGGLICAGVVMLLY